MQKRFTPDWDSVRSHTTPDWYEDCKVGIFVHWGAYSVPAYAPGQVELGAIASDEGWFCNNPYAEWYFNSVNVGRGAGYDYHVATYGKDYRYDNFVDAWKAESWRPDAWAKLFKDSGAGYVVLTTKHHDGFCLYNTDLTDYNTLRRGPQRDIMGELTRAVRQAGMRMGAYYSGILDWRFAPEPIFTNDDLRRAVPVTYEYADFAFKQSLELIDRYKPSVFWNDIGWPARGEDMLPSLLAHYYNAVPEGVINDRWNGLIADFTTKEYKQGQQSRSEKWEMCRGIGLSFGYNAAESPEHIMKPVDLIRLLVATVAGNGNLLINVGPMADGTIPQAQQAPLLAMGQWLKTNGEAIYGTRCDREALTLPGGVTAHFTQREGIRYMLLCDLPLGGWRGSIDGITGVPAPLASHITARHENGALEIMGYTPEDYAVVLQM